MLTWLKNLNRREQWFILIGGSVLLLISGYWLIWSPLNKAVTDKKRSVIYQQHLLQWMEQAHKELQQLKQEYPLKQTVASDQLLGQLDSTLQHYKLKKYLVSMQQTSDGNIRIQLKDVPFDLSLQWLTQLWVKHGIRVVSLSVQPHVKTMGLTTLTSVLT